MTENVYCSFWDGCGIILRKTLKSNLLTDLCRIISSDEVIMAHVNAGVLEKNLIQQNL